MSAPVTHLEWDSRFFRVSIARAEVDEHTVGSAVKQAAADGVQCLYLVIANAHPPALTDAILRGGRLVDLRVTFDLERRVSSPSGVRVAGPGEVARLVPLARRLSRSSRFSADPRFSREDVAAMYELWLARCMRDGLVVVPNRGIGGFVGVRPDRERLSVDLVYVEPRSRGRGIAARLVQGALARAGHTRARIATQAWNVSAQRVYQEIGFRTSSLNAIVHLWLGDPDQLSEATASATEASARLPSPPVSTIRSTT